MKIDSIKDLQKVIALCRKLGVDALEVDNVKFNLGAAPKRSRKAANEGDIFPEASLKVPQFTPTTASLVADTIASDELTEEQLLFYSARPEDSSIEQQG